MTRHSHPLARDHGSTGLRPFVLAAVIACAGALLVLLGTFQAGEVPLAATDVLPSSQHVPTVRASPDLETVPAAAVETAIPAEPITARAESVPPAPVGDPPLVLRITALDAAGISVPTGSVHVAHAVRGLGDPADRREIMLHDVALPVDVEIPPERRRAEVTVSVPGYRPSFESIEQLRVVEGRWLAEDERHVREVRVRLERERSSVGRVSGRVRVDGQARIPRGLRIDVRPGVLVPSVALDPRGGSGRERPQSVAPSAGMARVARSRALLDTYALEYEAEVLLPGPHVLAITSEETVPQSIEVVVPTDLSSTPRDLDLATGIRLEVVAARPRERLELAGLEVQLEHAQVEAETSAFQV